ncbi:MAG TPA: DUF2272 domain-containing protein [Allosphingosinicella sp.]|nr:DUF2272 domain-containing protein [Allosphingosinicella sp.]
MSAFTDKVASQAKAELARWGNGTGRETADPYSGYVGEYWSFGLDNNNINGRTTFQDKKGKPYRPAWSSAFISYVMKKAGAGAAFYYHEGHIHYVVKSLRDAATPGTTAKFLGRNPQSHAPKVGDLINAGRGDSKGIRYATVLAAYGPKPVDQGAFMATHSDIVVSVDAAARKLRTIGGNVATDTVGEKTWQLNADGTLVKGKDLICVIECLL